MRTTSIDVVSGSRLITDLTARADDFVRDLGDGLLNVFVPHATAGLALIELGSGTESDLEEALERLLPTSDVYRHRHGSLGHGRDHVAPAFIAPSLTLPVVDGRIQLGTWQSICLVDPNGDNPHRRVLMSFVSDAS